MAGADRTTVLPIVEELELRDGELADELATVAALSARVGSIRGRAGEAARTLALAPAELEGVERLLGEAAESLERARSDLIAAERASASDEARAAARDARERVAMLEERQARLAERRADVDRSRAAAESALRELAEEATALTAQIASSPRLGNAALSAPQGPGELTEWAEAAGAALLLARGTLEDERGRVVREAAELATAALGEPIGLGSVATLRRRLERELA